jgi:seryl-tRNA synthetase
LGGFLLLDAKLLRNEFDRVKQAMLDRGKSLDEVNKFAALDTARRELLQEAEQLKNRRNVVSQEVAGKKKNGESADSLIEEMRIVSDRIKVLDDELRVVEVDLNLVLLSIQNIPHASVPVGKTEEENVEIRRWSEPTTL